MLIVSNNYFIRRIWSIFLVYIASVISTAYSDISQGEVKDLPPGIDSKSLQHAISLRDKAMKGTDAFAIVESLTREIGPRLAGTLAEARARQWAVKHLSDIGFDLIAETFKIFLYYRVDRSITNRYRTSFFLILSQASLT